MNSAAILLAAILAFGFIGDPVPTAPATGPAEASCSSAPRDDRKFTDASKEDGRQHREAILREAKELNEHPWAGEYYFGDGLGVNVSIALAPKNGFVFSWHGCLGMYDQNWGEVVVDPDEGSLHLRCHFNNTREGFQGIATDLQPVRWGDRHYLVPVSELLEFCNHVNSGSETRRGVHGRFALRRGDEKLAVEGSPEVPAKYQRFLLSKPIMAKISDIDGEQIIVDIGSIDGAFAGMQMFVEDREYVVRSLKLTEVGDRTSKAMEGFNCFPDSPALKPALQLSTSAPWAR